MTSDVFTESDLPVFAGSELLPGYRRGADGAWLTLPWPDDFHELPPSLGPQVIAWAEKWLRHHLTGNRWKYTTGQRRFLYMWYAVKEDGGWLYTSGCKRGAKGTGKDPLLSSMCAIEGWGPVEVYDWDEKKGPIGRRRNMSLVQIGANSEGQAADVLRVMNATLTPEMQHEYAMDLGIHRTQSYDGSRVELLTSSEKSSEGDPATAAFLNETHHMTKSSGGHKLSNVARRNVGKSPTYIGARLCEFTNAHLQGQESVAELTYETWQMQVTGKTRRATILYDSVEADPGLDITDEDQLMLGLRQAYRDSSWSDLERIRDEVQDLRTSLADSIRYYMNGLGTAQDAWIDPQNVDSQADRDATLAEKDQITMFLDCSKSGDATALVACRLSDGHIFTLGIWQSDKVRREVWRAPRNDVDARVREAFFLYRVAWFGVDISSSTEDEDPDELYWRELADGWHRDFHKKLKVWAAPGAIRGHSVIFDMRMSIYGGKERNRSFTEMAMQVAKEIDEEGTFVWDGHPLLRRHLHNARRRPNEWGVTLSKDTRTSRNWIDGGTATVGAKLGRRIALNSGKVKLRSGAASF